MLSCFALPELKLRRLLVCKLAFNILNVTEPAPTANAATAECHVLYHLSPSHIFVSCQSAVLLQDTAVRPSSRDSINWSLYDKDGKLNLGLVGFISLSAGCLGVWVAGLVSWISYSRWVCSLMCGLMGLASKSCLHMRGSAHYLA